MTSELVYRMRTCAAALLDCSYATGSAPRDAANLLAEASNLLDVPEPLGELMKELPAVMSNQQAAELMSGAVWTAAGELPDAVPRPCPSCGNVGARTVHIAGRRLMLTCAMCSHQWEYRP